MYGKVEKDGKTQYYIGNSFIDIQFKVGKNIPIKIMDKKDIPADIEFIACETLKVLSDENEGAVHTNNKVEINDPHIKAVMAAIKYLGIKKGNVVGFSDRITNVDFYIKQQQEAVKQYETTWYKNQMELVKLGRKEEAIEAARNRLYTEIYK